MHKDAIRDSDRLHKIPIKTVEFGKSGLDFLWNFYAWTADASSRFYAPAVKEGRV